MYLFSFIWLGWGVLGPGIELSLLLQRCVQTAAATLPVDPKNPRPPAATAAQSSAHASALPVDSASAGTSRRWSPRWCPRPSGLPAAASWWHPLCDTHSGLGRVRYEWTWWFRSALCTRLLCRHKWQAMLPGHFARYGRLPPPVSLQSPSNRGLPPLGWIVQSWRRCCWGSCWSGIGCCIPWDTWSSAAQLSTQRLGWGSPACAHRTSDTRMEEHRVRGCLKLGAPQHTQWRFPSRRGSVGLVCDPTAWHAFAQQRTAIACTLENSVGTH